MGKIPINFGRVHPSFMVIGVQKGGTSSIYSYLSQHPSILVPKTKELHYFDTHNSTPKEPYLKNFPKSYFSRKITFEATPRYIYYPSTAQKLYEFNSKLKFIIILRNPVKRAFSAWNMYKQLAQNPKIINASKNLMKQNSLEQLYKYYFENNFPSFQDAITLELSNDFGSEIIEPSLVKRGYYKTQIETYLNFFPKESFLFIDFDSFKKETLLTLKQITNFLGISEFNYDFLNLEPMNKRTYDSKINENLYYLLLNHFQLKNKGLEELINLELNWMNKN